MCSSHDDFHSQGQAKQVQYPYQRQKDHSDQIYRFIIQHTSNQIELQVIQFD